MNGALLCRVKFRELQVGDPSAWLLLGSSCKARWRGLELISRPKASGVTSNIKVADERVQLGRLVQQRHGHVGSGVSDGSGHDRCLNAWLMH